MNLLEVRNICKTYGSGETSVKALKDVSFSVPRGEYVAVVGESGSGKSTLLNMIGALDIPTSGKVLIDGKDIFSMNDRKLTVFRRRNIGFIFQAFNLIPELTVEQNMIFPMLFGLSEAGQKISGRASDCTEFKRSPELPAKPAFRRPAAESGHWTRADYPSGFDPCRRANRKSGYSEQQRGDRSVKRGVKKI